MGGHAVVNLRVVVVAAVAAAVVVVAALLAGAARAARDAALGLFRGAAVLSQAVERACAPAVMGRLGMDSADQLGRAAEQARPSAVRAAFPALELAFANVALQGLEADKLVHGLAT